jgi:hypothetical protein
MRRSCAVLIVTISSFRGLAGPRGLLCAIIAATEPRHVCRYPGMRQDCARAAMELQSILAKALCDRWALPPSNSLPRRTPNPFCRNFSDTDCVEASICPEFLRDFCPFEPCTPPPEYTRRCCSPAATPSTAPLTKAAHHCSQRPVA